MKRFILVISLCLLTSYTFAVAKESDIDLYLANYTNLSVAEKQNIVNNKKDFISIMNQVINLWKKEPYLLELVDNNNVLASTYIPNDLVVIDNVLSKNNLTKKGLKLRQIVIKDLQDMIKQAKKDSITLEISSTYRSFSKQEATYQGWVEKLGETEAKRTSAIAGASQHQLGTVVDFGSINESFNDTPQQLWLAQNASNYGWSISYPNGFESETKFKYESWHYRYIGKDACILQKKYFNDLQYKLLNFIKANKNLLITE